MFRRISLEQEEDVRSKPEDEKLVGMQRGKKRKRFREFHLTLKG